MNPNPLPKGFRFLIVRRISDQLAWIYIRSSASGLSCYLYRGPVVRINLTLSTKEAA